MPPLAAYATFIGTDTGPIYDGVVTCPIVSATVFFFVLQNFRFAIPSLPGLGGPRSAQPTPSADDRFPALPARS